MFLSNELDKQCVSLEVKEEIFENLHDEEIFKVCYAYIQEELDEACELMASHLIGKLIDGLEVEYAEKYYQTCNDVSGRFDDILGG